MKRKRYIIVLTAVLFICKSGYSQLKINPVPDTGRFELTVNDYLNEDGLFTLVLKDNDDEELGKTIVYILLRNQQGKSFAHHLYTVDFSLDQKFKKSKTYMIDDNSVRLNSKGKYVIYNQGQGDGYSDDEVVEFLPPKIKEGSYDFQVALYIENADIYVYSNIIRLDIPINDIN